MAKSIRRKGVVFFTTLILLSIVVLLCAGITVLIFRDTFTVRKIRCNAEAYFLAEAGIEEGLRDINNNFDYTPSGYPKNLGVGAYSVTVGTYPGDTTRRLVTSTGTITSGIFGTITRRIRVQVHYAGPSAFNFSAIGGGKLTVAGGSVVSDTGPISVHSNSPANSKALAVGDKDGTGRIEGNVSACGHVDVYDEDSTVTGTITNYAPFVDLPPFDDNFFAYYYNLARADDNVKEGGQDFWSDPCAGKPNRVCYVTGEARLHGTWSMTGCIVAERQIIVNRLLPLNGGYITINQWQNMPALMSRYSNIEIWDPCEINGLIYANGWILIDSWWGHYGPVVINGALYGSNWVRISAATQLHYRRPNPPGLPSGTVSIKVVSWSED